MSVERAEKLEALVNQSEAWVQNCCSPEERESRLQELNRIGRETRLMSRVSERRTSVILFGLSQAGKSYLVHAMTSSPDTGRLTIELGGNGVDFLREMNPAGGRESTGFATRFTVQDSSGDLEFPVRASLLGVMDVASVIANSYFQDIQSFDPSIGEDEVRRMLERAQGLAAKDDMDNGVTMDDAAWFVEYVTKTFKDLTWVQNMSSWGYWDALVKLAPRLPLNELIALVELSWCRLEFWSTYFKDQVQELKKLSFGTEVLMEVASVRPQTETVLDVERVYEPYDSNRQEKSDVRIKVDGQIIAVRRSTLTALIREVTLPLSPAMAKGERKFMEAVDVLDFPGARSRKKMDQAVFESNSDKDNAELIVRGKVGYLFDLYNREMGIGAMVYCIDADQSEVQDVPRLVYQWISRSVGEDAERRAQRQSQLAQDAGIPDARISPLMVAMTKFDMTMQGNQELLGDPSVHNTRWSARFKTNFEDWLTAPVEDKWIKNWNGSTFQEVYPIRNPQYSGTFMSSGEDGVESGVREEQEQRMKETGVSFIGHPDVQRFIKEPAETWEALISPNGTGAKALLKALSTSVQPSLHKRQIEGQLAGLEESLDELLRPMYVSGDHAENLKLAKEKSAQVAFALAGLRATLPGAVSQWVKSGFITEGEARTAYYQVYEERSAVDAGVQEQGEAMDVGLSLWQVARNLGLAADPKDAIESLLSRLVERFGMDESTVRDMLTSQYGEGIFDVATELQANQELLVEKALAERVVSRWISNVRKGSDSSALQAMGVPVAQQSYLKELAGSLIEGRSRVGLSSQVEQAVKDDLGQAPTREGAMRSALAASAVVNRYVRSFGLEGKDLFQVSDLDLEASLPPLLSEPRGASPFLKDWMQAAQHSFLANLEHEQGHMDPIKLKCNTNLKQLLDEVGKS